MHAKAKFIFWIILFLYVVTLVFATYVGVYLTYIAIPLIVLSGIVMKMTKPKNRPETVMDSTVRELGGVVTSTADGVSNVMKGVNISLRNYNEKNNLIRERTQKLRTKMHSLQCTKIEPEVAFRYEKDDVQRAIYKKKIDEIDLAIELIELEIEEIIKQCEIEMSHAVGKSQSDY